MKNAHRSPDLPCDAKKVIAFAPQINIYAWALQGVPQDFEKRVIDERLCKSPSPTQKTVNIAHAKESCRPSNRPLVQPKLVVCHNRRHLTTSKRTSMKDSSRIVAMLQDEKKFYNTTNDASYLCRDAFMLL